MSPALVNLIYTLLTTWPSMMVRCFDGGFLAECDWPNERQSC
jgi:hypothetical protein